VTGAHPSISLLDLTASNAMPVKLPIAVMRGVDEGADDIHYGKTSISSPVTATGSPSSSARRRRSSS
jgi:hypothetical protein